MHGEPVRLRIIHCLQLNLRFHDTAEAITSVYPQTIVQTCIVNLIRNSLAFVSWKDRKAILPAIKAIYQAESADIALARLEELEAE